MNRFLAGLRVIEASSFVAAPSCALHLAQFGAEVIRIDQIGGGPDFRRWPLAPGSGTSLYWEGLNKCKKSVALDFSRPEGRALAASIITAAGNDAGLFVTNFPSEGFLSYDRLSRLRRDLICVRIMGWPDGRSAVDYTVNAAVGVPAMTGPTDRSDPVNHVLPAWDLLAGAYAAFALMAAERARRIDGRGREICIPLSDIAIASLGHLGQIGEVQTTGNDRARYGNELYGAFGRDFQTLDCKRLMVVAITPRQWSGLVTALSIRESVEALERQLGVQFDRDEGVRFEHRWRLVPIIAEAIANRTSSELSVAFETHAVCWSFFHTLKEALASERHFSSANPLLTALDHGSGHRYLTPGAAVRVSSESRDPPRPAPSLGQDTDQVLASLLGLSSAELMKLHAERVVASP